MALRKYCMYVDGEERKGATDLSCWVGWMGGTDLQKRGEGRSLDTVFP